MISIRILRYSASEEYNLDDGPLILRSGRAEFEIGYSDTLLPRCNIKMHKDPKQILGYTAPEVPSHIPMRPDGWVLAFAHFSHQARQVKLGKFALDLDLLGGLLCQGGGRQASGQADTMACPA